MVSIDALRATAPVNLDVERPFSSTATGRFWLLVNSRRAKSRDRQAHLM